MPWPRTNTSVFAVPRSIAKSLENFVAQPLDNTFSPGLDSIALSAPATPPPRTSAVWPCGILQVVVASRHFVPPTTPIVGSPLGHHESRCRTALAVDEALSVSPVAAPSPLALFVLPFVFAASPLSLVGPLSAPILMPARGLAFFPLVPVVRRNVVVPHRYEQDRTRHELRLHDDPWAVVPRAHIPAAVRESPVLAIEEEEVGGLGRPGRHVLDAWGLGNDNQGRRGGKMDADVDVHLSVDRRSHHDSQERADNEDVHRASRPAFNSCADRARMPFVQ